MIKEIQGELDECSTKYVDQLTKMVHLGLFEKAQALIQQNDDKIQEMIRNASESAEIMN